MSDQVTVPKELLEVVAWQDAENQLYTTGEKRQMHGWATDGYPIVELVRLSDATAVIDQQAARIAELQKDADRYRWLRERGDAFQWENILRFDLDECNYADNAQALDAAIDAAMEGSKGE